VVHAVEHQDFHNYPSEFRFIQQKMLRRTQAAKHS